MNTAGTASSATTGALTAAQTRVVDAALRLFARHGVGGTSLQMIADEIGVTKAAVYHQYQTKESIVLAAAESELDRVAAVVETAESHDDAATRRDAMLRGMVDLAVDRRRMTRTILEDPAVTGFFAEDPAFRRVMRGVRRVLLGDSPDAESRVITAMLIAAISGAATNAMVVDLDDEVLRTQLLRLARRFLDDGDEPPGT